MHRYEKKLPLDDVKRKVNDSMSLVNVSLR